MQYFLQANHEYITKLYLQEQVDLSYLLMDDLKLKVLDLSIILSFIDLQL